MALNITAPTKEELELELRSILSSLNPRQVAAVTTAPQRVRLQYAKTLSSGNSRAAAVKLKCYECVGFEDVANRVKECNVTTCPLWMVR